MILFYSFQIRFFGDDFGWLLAARDNTLDLLPDYAFSPDPFSYFRPLPKMFFFVTWNLFHDNFWMYRIFIVLLQICSVILIYKIALALKYDNVTAFISALMFSVLTCHTEALFFINCINELFSAFFILWGLYLFSKYPDLNIPRIIAVILLFTAALFSRESAVCYFPLILLFNFLKVRHKWKNVLFILIIPVLIYAAARLLSEMYFPDSNLGTTFSTMDFNPVKLSYKIIHYFIMMLFPVKIIFEFLGFDSLEFLIKIYRHPAENLFSFILFSLLILFVLILILSYILKKLKKEIIFPVLFTLSALFIYLFSFSTAERYSYLPSAGLCLLLGILYSKISYSEILKVFFILFIGIHLISLLQRSYRYRQAVEFSHQSIKNLNEVTKNIENGSLIFMQSLPPKKYGIYFLNVPN
nr:hypothetical protein [Ignavibacteria bacterium]